MPCRFLPNRADEYGMRAKECRGNADLATTDQDRVALFEIAGTWECMANWEDKTNPSPPARRSS